MNQRLRMERKRASFAKWRGRRSQRAALRAIGKAAIAGARHFERGMQQLAERMVEAALKSEGFAAQLAIVGESIRNAGAAIAKQREGLT